MIGIIVELIISWLVLWLAKKKNLNALGVKPSVIRITDFFAGFLISAAMCAIYNFVNVTSASNQWVLNKSFTIQTFISSAWWMLNSVLFEELIFHGALLYVAIERFGLRPACCLSAAAFGIYHWFSFGVFGNPGSMVMVFLMTLIPGLMFAFAFAITRSLYLPIGLHFGWNLISSVIFSRGPLGDQLLVRVNENEAQGLLSLATFMLQLFGAPLIIWWHLAKRKDIYSG